MPHDPRLRRPVAVLLSRFPLITETFILREISELERQGQPVLLVPMIREHPAVIHEEARPWIERALFTPWFSAGIALAVLRGVLRRPLALARIFAWIVFGAIVRPATLVKSLMLVPKSIYLAEQLQAAGIHHLHAHFATHPTTIARIVSMLTGITFSFTVHAHDIFVDRTLLRRKIRDARFIRSISRFNQHLLETLYPAEASGKIEVVHVGIETSKYDLPAAPHNEVPRLICIAALKPYKGVQFLVQACRLLADEGLMFRCDIIGSGPLRSRVRRAIVEAGLHDRIRLRGALPQHVVAEELRASDIFVLPSVIAADGQMEGIPVALMEAMAASRPVVASAISGIPELVQDGITGLLSDPANPRHLADVLRRLILDAPLRRRLGDAGREEVQRAFELSTCTAELASILDAHNPPPEDDAIRMIEAIAEPGAAYGVREHHRSRDASVLEVLRAKAGGEPDEVIVKQHLSRAGESRPAGERAEREFVLLQRLQRHFAPVDALGVPAPLGLDREAATVAMSRAIGVPLTKLVRDARDGRAADSGALRQAAQATGRWLHHFQRMESGDGKAALEALTVRSLDRARALRMPRRIVDRITSLHDQLASRPRPAVSHHGDFWPGNVFAHGTAVEVVDFEGYATSLAAHDITYFFLHLSLYFRFHSERWLMEVREAFFDGYAGALDPAELELCRLACALQMAAAPPPNGIAHRVIRQLVLRKEFSR